MKMSVSYSRKVCTPVPYEMLSVGESVEFHLDEMKPCDAFRMIRNFVDDKVEQTLHEMEAKKE